MILSNLFKAALQGWGIKGSSAQSTGSVLPPDFENEKIFRSAALAAIHSVLRTPLAYPAIVDYEMVARLKSAGESADYMVAHMMNARNLVQRADLLDFALAACSVEGLVMEFGVFRGESLSFIARRVKEIVHGFDSFEGLPEDWTYFQKQGRFSLGGNVPEFREENIRAHKGWFEETLPGFLEANSGAARFVHIDCDIYSSARTVLAQLSSRIVKGTVIVFDEYLNYPAWREHEYRAFQEFVAASGLSYRYIGFASSHTSVAVVIT